jgi:hypothetical protein
MISAAADHEVSILARVLGNDRKRLPRGIARYLLSRGFDQADKDRMHDLAVRNQAGDLSEVELEELRAYARTGAVLSILQSKARRVLKLRPSMM